MTEPERISESELHAYVDGELTPIERDAIAAWLAAHPEDAQRVGELEAINRALASGYASRLEEPIPEAMRRRVTAIAPSSRLALPWRAIAAGLCCALLGAGIALLVVRWQSTSGPQTTFADQALGAHAVYVGEVRHPVEVAASEETHLVQWLTRKIGANVRAPQLNAFGFRLVGGRLLPDLGRPAAQFMFEDSGGRRLTLYVRKEAGEGNTSFSLVSHDGLEAFYWIDRPLAYAIVGRLPREELLPIARAVYEQLN
jgi:anti-sigma factor RsiW